MRLMLRIYSLFELDHLGRRTGDLSRGMHFYFTERSTLQWRLLNALPPRQVHFWMLTARNPWLPAVSALERPA
jgi:hypothetical protein